jgi:dTDP-4-amino-4,6-dideoxy-D-galactose acyltransferase
VSAAQAVCELLEWDTRFFGFGVGRVCADALTQEQVAHIEPWCRQHGVRCLYFLARPDDPTTTRLAEQNGFHLVDVRVSLDCAVSSHACVPQALPAPPVAVQQARSGDRAALRSIARQSHRDSRFYYDPGFPRDACDRLYEAWIERSCDGYADAVLVAGRAGRLAGYISCHREGEEGGRIGLVGVSCQARGAGVGQALVLSAVDWFRQQSVRRVSVVTQGRNCAAQRLYQRCGFLTRAVHLWYHRWYEDVG